MTELTDLNFEAEVLQAAGPVLVDFWAPWCGPCRMMAPVLEKIAGQFAGKLKVAKLNVDDAPQTSARFGVSAIPTLIIFKGGKEAGKQIGVVPEEALKQMVEANIQ